MTTGPAPSCSRTSSEDSAAVTAAAPPGSTRRLRHAYRLRPVAVGLSSIRRVVRVVGGVAQPEVEDGQLFFEVRAEQHDRRCRRGARRWSPGGDRGAPPGARHRAGRRGRRRARRRGGPRRRRPRWCRGRHRAQRRAEGPFVASVVRMASVTAVIAVVPRGRLAAYQRRRHPCRRVDGLEAEAALVAEPAPVDRVAVDAEVAHELVTARLHGDAASDRARGARARRLAEVPRAGLEAVRRGGERTDRADLHRVAGEVRR